VKHCFPLTREAAEFIIGHGCINTGVDNTSPDMWLDKTYPYHTACREREVTHRENLRNLDQLVGKKFTLKAAVGPGGKVPALPCAH